MKTTTWLLLFALLIVSIFCNDSILSKFHQNRYKIKDVRTQVMSYNKKYFYFFELKTFKYNRTTTAINGTLKMKISTKDKIEVVVQAFKFLSNEYRHFPMRFQINLKKFFDTNALGLDAIRKCGNFTSFIFEKDVVYHGCNFVIDDTHLPPLIPNGMFKVDLQLLYLNEEIALHSLFAEIYTPMVYPK